MKFGNLARLHRKLSMIGFIVLSSSSCVSVNLGPKAATQSKGVQLLPPNFPYTTLKQTHADGAWQNPKNGNSISYFSTCNDPSEAGLDSLSRELFSEMRELKQIYQNTIVYNGREALDQVVEGKVDGVLTRVHALIFKKNGCTYTLSFIGVPRAFDSDLVVFESFMKGFQAP